MDSEEKAFLIFCLGLFITLITLISWAGFNFYYDKSTCKKYTDNGYNCIERFDKNAK